MKTMKYLFFTCVIISIVLLSSCYNDNEEDIYKYFTATSCDSANITYSKHIKTLFDSKCSSCHNGTDATCNLNNFANAHAYAIIPNTNLYTYVSDGTHKNQVLTDCEKKQLKLWIETGAN